MINENKSETSREIYPWESHHENIFVDWADKAACYKWLHNKSYLKYSSKRNLFTIPVIVMSTLTGTANFALERVPIEYQDICSIGIGSVNILAGIITTIAQFLKLNELTESHRVASIAWDKFHRSIRLELIKSPEERTDVTYFMKSSRDEFDRLMETCPPIDKSIADMFRVELTKGKDKTEVARKLKNFNKLIKPEIFNELTSIKEVIFKMNPSSIIDVEDRVKIAKMTAERDNYKKNVAEVSNFIETFRNKYSRHPSEDEIIDNTIGISRSDLKMIILEISKV
tara:strand:- start:2537 stop:3388 length:852 start_codon:yes stop_codon:yes gene_type:complete